MPWFVAPNGFASFAARLADAVPVRQSTHVVGIRRTPTGWEVAIRDAPSEHYSQVIVTVPLAQAIALTPPAQREMWDVDALSARQYHEPCWSLSIELAAPVAVPFDAIRSATSDIAWLARETSKPGRAARGDVWTLHASREFSETHLEAEPDVVTGRLTESFAAIVGTVPDVRATHAHRWRYARAITRDRDDPGYRYDTAEGFGLAGDALAGPRLELAYLSGIGLAGACLRAFAAEGAPDRTAAHAHADRG